MTSPKLSANCVLSKYFAHKLSDVMTSPNLSANCALSKLILLFLQYCLCLFILPYAVLILLLLSSAVLVMPVYTVLCSSAYACLKCLYCLMQCLYCFSKSLKEYNLLLCLLFLQLGDKNNNNNSNLLLTGCGKPVKTFFFSIPIETN